MSGKRSTKNLTVEEYEGIKKLIDMDIKTSMIQQITGRGRGTIAAIARSNNLEEMRAKNTEIRRRYSDRSNVTPSPAPVETPEPTLNERLVVAAEQQLLAIQQLNVSVQRLVHAWESTPDKKKKFGIV